MSYLFNSRKWMIITGVFIGVAAALLQRLGNPPNMGICVACMVRDISGVVGLHRAGAVQFIRPEIIGFVLGALLAALAAREFRARAGSTPIIRFMLGFFVMIGALVFLGCPWRALLRLAGGDGNAILGLVGVTGGIGIGILFIKSGFNLGRNYTTQPVGGLIIPLIMVGLLLLLILRPVLPSGVLFFSERGPGAQHAPIIITLLFGLAIGFLAQRTRFCTVGAIRDLILLNDHHLLSGVLALLGTAFLVNLILGQFSPGFADQPVAHTGHLWNFGGMVLVGLASVLAGGCPGRQLFLAGEGDGDGAAFVLGMFGGAAFAHNFATASSAIGPAEWGPASVIIGLIFCLIIGFSMRDS
ncbi:YedE-related selenium metabolism membrane protein [Candidatus Acetothermia bacterium]|jgi:YedE family putative selenium metabolism protein|nr:YedE-related selenium metabolism membrane protein [Candidatus Acetothermia bacterium]MCI2427329.1 YedE-related selenium metabolism membrane protein [Candidatus Acetothermia bacterium]MCI2428495.1 YedE-related selenium metabolism membrane protein [Candidatus Acetothermia bacterium]